MEVVKKVFGVLLFGVAVYYVAPLVSAQTTSIVVGLLLLAFAIHLAWPLLRPKEGDEKPSGTRLAFGAASAIAGLYFTVGLFALPADGALPGPLRFLEPPSAIAWRSDYAGTLDASAAEKKPVLLDFTADWCAQCKEMDHLTFHDAGVLGRLEKYLKVRLDATNIDGPEGQVMRKFALTGLPGVVLISPEAAPHLK
jgi:thiol:disulfide interchange protein DsbD